MIIPCGSTISTTVVIRYTLMENGSDKVYLIRIKTTGVMP